MSTTLTPAAERVCNALSEHPGATAAELADASGLTRQAVGVALGALAGLGLARKQQPDRADGAKGKGKLPALWYTTTPADPDPAAAAQTGQSDPDANAQVSDLPDAQVLAAPGTDQPETADPEDPGPAAAHRQPRGRARTSPVTEPAPGASQTLTPAPDERAPALTEAKQSTASAADAHSPADPERLAPVIALPTARASADAGTSTPRVTKSGKPVRAKGELYDEVAAYLAAHPDQAPTAGQVGRAINASPGAVTLVFNKLVIAELAVLACEEPKTVRWITTPVSPADSAAPAESAGSAQARAARRAHGKGRAGGRPNKGS